MGPILICDKSTLQALNQAELSVFRKYYFLCIPPVLLVEVLGDLKKHANNETSQSEVRVLASKLVPACSVVHVDFRDLIRAELRGFRFPMERRPVVTGGDAKVSAGGKKGICFEESSESKALLRWQVGNFLEAEELLAQAWRSSTQAIDLNRMQRMLHNAYSAKLKLRSLEETTCFVGDLMAAAPADQLLKWFVSDVFLFSGSSTAGQELQSTDLASVQKLPPYTEYCIRTALVFHFALVFGLVSTKPTNRVDLEYFFYIPFCHAFSSGDHFHRSLAPHILQNREFVWRDEIKQDLSHLAKRLSDLSPEERDQESLIVGPPENDASITHNLWKKAMRPGYRDQKLSKSMPSTELSARIRQEMEAVRNGTPIEGTLNDSDCDMMIMQHSVRGDGPCICGSFKLFKDCCGFGLAPNQKS